MPFFSDEVIQQVERAPALARAGADLHGERCGAGELVVGRERDRREVVARGPAAILGELDERGQGDLVTVDDVFEITAIVASRLGSRSS